MSSYPLSNIKTAGKSLLLLSVYLLHFGFFQFLVSSSADSYKESFQKLFPYRTDSSNRDGQIAIFRVLEKHDTNKESISVSKQVYATLSILLKPLVESTQLSSPDDGDPRPVTLSDISYRRYMRIGIFLI